MITDIIGDAYRRRRDALTERGIPFDIARGQAADDTRRSILRGLHAGATVREVSEHTGVPVKSIFKALQVLARRNPVSPMEAYFWEKEAVDTKDIKSAVAKRHKREAALERSKERLENRIARHRAAYDAKCRGLTYRQIGRAAGVSATTARKWFLKGKAHYLMVVAEAKRCGLVSEHDNGTK